MFGSLRKRITSQEWYQRYAEWHRLIRGKRTLQKAALASELRLVIGASGIVQDGWVGSEQEFLDLLKPYQWERYFGQQHIAAILAEHVWEHLSEEAGFIAAKTCWRFLKPGGYLRIAVPDGYHPSSAYIDYVRPGGKGAGADDHKVLYTYKTLGALLEQAGFHVNLLEYFDEQHMFHCVDWHPEDGLIRRSARFDVRNVDGQLNYTSLILDAVKLDGAP